MRKFAAPLVAVAFAVTACQAAPDEALRETADQLGEIHSADMSLSVRISGTDESEGTTFGFDLSGPFALASEEGELPIADVDYTQLAGDESETVRFLSTGRSAYVVVNDQPYQLTDEQIAGMQAGGGSQDADPLEQLGVEEWIDDAEISDGGQVDGVETERITGDVDLAEVMNDLFALAGRLGADTGGFAPIGGDAADQLDGAVRSSRLELYTGTDDRLLRRLSMVIEIGPDPGSEIQEILGPLSESEFRLDMELERLNEEVNVEEPGGAVPVTELPAA